MFLGIGAIQAIGGVIASMIPNKNGHYIFTFKPHNNKIPNPTTKQEKTRGFNIISDELLRNKEISDFEIDSTEYHGDTYMPPFTYDRCFKLVKKLYYENDYSNYRWYCIYKDFWYDCGSICKNCKYNRQRIKEI